jgi:hypothetical protein
MKTINLHNSLDIKGIYVTPANKIIGIPLFRQNGQEYRESPKCVELWQKNGDGGMHLKKRWRKTSITYIEYADIPNTWVEPRARALQHK